MEGRIEFRVLANRLRKKTNQVRSVHTQFIKLCHQFFQTEEWLQLVSLAITLRPSLNPLSIGYIDWVVDSDGRRDSLVVELLDEHQYPSSEEIIQIPFAEVPQQILEEFDKRWEQIVRNPWLRPKPLGPQPLNSVLKFPRPAK